MENLWQDNAELREYRGLIERIKRGNCVLVLGPRVAIRPNDPDRRPLDELLSCELLKSINVQHSVALLSSKNLRCSAELYFRRVQDREDLEIAVRDFYAHKAKSTTSFHCDLARLPFRLCISASPDSLMLKAFLNADKSPQKGYYNFKKSIDLRLSSPTPDKPLVYYLFGHFEDPSSLVLTEGDLIEFLVSLVRGTPPVPDEVRSILSDSSASFLFLGFGFHNWYLRVLLQVMNVYGHISKAIAFEDSQFFNHPEHEQVVEFFSGKRFIDFQPLRWEAFAQQLRKAYDASLPKSPEATLILKSPPPNSPKAFISYASEDRVAVEALAGKLEERGIRVWQDKQDLRAGDDWNRVLFDVIARFVDYVIVVQTIAMTTAIQGVFQREIEAALQRQAEMGEFEGKKFRFIVPIRIGACERLSSLEKLHEIDVSEISGVDLLVKSILEDWDRRTALNKSRPQEVA